MHNYHFRRYLVALILSVMVFSTGFLTSNMLASKKLENVRNVEDNISLSILSSETEFELLKEVACDSPNITHQTSLNKEIGDLAEKLSILEANNEKDERIISAKKRYSLLLLKDYLLSKKISENCATKPAFIIYFYGNADICPNCVKTGSALTSLREDYERLRVYPFDMNLDLPLIKSFANVYNIKPDALPAIIINGKVYGGLTTKDEIDVLIPKEIKNLNSTTTATSSKSAIRKIIERAI